VWEAEASAAKDYPLPASIVATAPAHVSAPFARREGDGRGSRSRFSMASCHRPACSSSEGMRTAVGCAINARIKISY
jgi:hypothetical protein